MKIIKAVASCEYDYARDVALFAFEDGMAIFASGYDMRRWAKSSHIDRARNSAGQIATFELVNGRWTFQRLDPPEFTG